MQLLNPLPVYQGTFSPKFSIRCCNSITTNHASLVVAAPPLRRRCYCYDLYDQQVPYRDAWEWQKSMVDTRAQRIQEGTVVDDALVILQHPPVYTLGTRSSEKYLLFDKDDPPCDLYRTERGGEVTYHGPGQLVIYPILNLRHHKMDLHWYLRSLEEVAIRALWAACAIEASRIEGLTGVWVGDKKVAAIGVRVSRWITYHGMALNVTTDLSPFKKIIPCGINNRPVGSVLELLQDQTQLQPTDMLTELSNGYDPHYLLDLLHQTLLQEFSKVFEIDLVHARKDDALMHSSRTALIVKSK